MLYHVLQSRPKLNALLNVLKNRQHVSVTTTDQRQANML